jgi:hypothetical protein
MIRHCFRVATRSNALPMAGPAHYRTGRRLTQTIDLMNGMAELPALIIHTGEITHLSKPAEFDLAQQMLARFRTTELRTVPGEYDTTDPTVSEYFNRSGKVSANRGYYSFDHAGVHFILVVTFERDFPAFGQLPRRLCGVST